MKATIKVLAATAALVIGTAAGATVYCPGNNSYTDVGNGYVNTTSTAVPIAGLHTPSTWSSYIYSDSFKNNAQCYWVDGNLDPANGWQEFNAFSSEFNYANYLVKVEIPATDPLGILTFSYDPSFDATNDLGKGTFNISGVDSTQPLFIGFHFGNGQDAPDSYIVQLSALSGDFFFYSPPNGGPGLSNIYVFGTRGGEEVPEPGSLALLGVGLAGLALIRRRRRD